ncbi:MAG TPA: pYEATS domain-containing protein [Chthoniobacterales bacterium]|nr:pYEATS domain-containing protein [Chthoniobacterales bacterium]
MNFAVAQSQKYEGDNWWKWSLWIQGSEDDLDEIKSVTYTLHSTFPEPIRTVTDRASKFQLRCSGWGIFLIPVEVRLKNGQSIKLRHQLQFSVPRNLREEEE